MGWVVLSLEPIGAFGVGVWKNIRKVGILSQDSLDLLWGMVPRSAFGMICGVGTALKVAFPALFGIARVKGAFVVDNLEFLGDSN
jgi:hypothetical protein